MLPRSKKSFDCRSDVRIFPPLSVATRSRKPVALKITACHADRRTDRGAYHAGEQRKPHDVLRSAERRQVTCETLDKKASGYGCQRVPNAMPSARHRAGGGDVNEEGTDKIGGRDAVAQQQNGSECDARRRLHRCSARMHECELKSELAGEEVEDDDWPK